MTRVQLSTRGFVLFAVLALVFAACGGSGVEEVDPGTTPDAAEDVPDEGTSGASGLVIAPGFPAEMPVPSGVTEVRDAAYLGEGAYTAYVPRPVAEVIAEFESSLPAMGWEIVDRVEAVAWVDDMMFNVAGHGLEMSVYAEPQAGSETETLVSYLPKRP